MSPKRDLTKYRVFIHARGKSKPAATGDLLGLERLPATWLHEGKSYFWSGCDDVEKAVVFSEIDPRINV